MVRTAEVPMVGRKTKCFSKTTLLCFALKENKAFFALIQRYTLLLSLGIFDKRSTSNPMLRTLSDGK